MRFIQIAVTVGIAGVVLMPVSSTALDMGARVKAGLAISNLYGKDIKDGDHRIDSMGGSIDPGLGFAGYGLFNIKFIDYIGAEVGVGFGMKGRTTTLEQSGMSTKMSLNMGYFQIPVLIQGIIPLGAVKPFIEAGPSIDILMYSSEKIKTNGAPYPLANLDTTIDAKDQMAAFDLGIAMGGGVEVPLGPGSIVLDIRYTLGLMTTDIVTNDEKALNPNAKALERKTWLLGIMTGYTYKF